MRNPSRLFPLKTNRTVAPPQPRPGILDIAPYVGGDSSVPGFEHVIKLASNESALGPSPRAVTAFRKATHNLHRYPDGAAIDLRQGLAAHYHLEEERIVCGNGSDELISLLALGYAGPGDEVLHSEHGFLMYPIAGKRVGATVIAAPETNRTTNVDALLACVSDKTRIVFLANPNNPTGTYLSQSELARLHTGLPDDCLLVIDSAYAEYVSRSDYDPGLSLAKVHPNVVMTRTFSKIYGLASLRVGWAYCSPEVAAVLNRLRGPFSVTAPSLAAACAALDDAAFTNEARTHNDFMLRWFVDEVRSLGYELTPSIANFVIIRFPNAEGKNADAAIAFLRAKSIIPRKIAAYGLPKWVRFSLGLEEEMRQVVTALTEFTRHD